MNLVSDTTHAYRIVLNQNRKKIQKPEDNIFKVSILKISNFGLFAMDHFRAFVRKRMPLKRFKMGNNSNKEVTISHPFVF